MKYIILYVFLSIGYKSISEDTLLSFIKSIENDTQKINILYQEGFKLRNSDPKRAYNLAKSAEKIALNNQSSMHLALSYNLLGIIEYKKGNYNEAYAYQKQSFDLNRKINNSLAMAHNQLNMGNIFSDINNYSLAENAYLSALYFYNETNYIKGNLNCLINLGVIKFEQKEYLAAIKNYQQALKIADTKNDYETKAICCNNIGAILMTINELDSAIGYIEESIKIKQLTENEIELADSYNNLAVIYTKKKQYDKAKQFIDSSEIIIKKHNYFDADLELTHTKYLLYQAQKHFELANYCLEKYVKQKDSLNALNTNINYDFKFEEKSLLSQPNSNFNTGFVIFTLILVTLSITILLLIINNKR